jgi:hypothetical protein
LVLVACLGGLGCSARHAASEVKIAAIVPLSAAARQGEL